MKENFLYQKIKMFFLRNFDIRQEKENEIETIQSLKSGVEFKGTNLWVLIFATLIASLGLNINSTAVIIGAMLISPLMGPTMGFGLGLGIYDFDLIKKALRNFITATVFSVLASTLYFLISPLSEAQSELLARTAPTLYDVLIAFFGGISGIIASSTKYKGNVIPGVAIATALMPPLCTAGFGLATGNLFYFFGAIYLYLINTVFISLATFFVVRLLRYPQKTFIDNEKKRRVTRLISFIVFFTIVPSIYLSYNLIQKTLLNERIRVYINEELNFPDTQILNKKILETKDGGKTLEIVMIGKTIPESSLAMARLKLSKYNLSNMKLNIKQGFGKEETNVGELKALLMQDLYKNNEEVLRLQSIEIDSLKKELLEYKHKEEMIFHLVPEMKVLFPSINEASCMPAKIAMRDSTTSCQTTIVYVRVDSPMEKIEEKRLIAWLKARLNKENIKLIIQ